MDVGTALERPAGCVEGTREKSGFRKPTPGRGANRTERLAGRSDLHGAEPAENRLCAAGASSASDQSWLPSSRRTTSARNEPSSWRQTERVSDDIGHTVINKRLKPKLKT